jgi:hypothetical protein
MSAAGLCLLTVAEPTVLEMQYVARSARTIWTSPMFVSQSPPGLS